MQPEAWAAIGLIFLGLGFWVGLGVLVAFALTRRWGR